MMDNLSGNYLDIVLFIVLPYVAIFTFLLVTIQRYRANAFTYSSLSSQFLENRLHFWGSVPFHYGLLTVLAGHLVAFLVPSQILLWNSHPLRLTILEVSAFTCGILTLVGLVNIILRRIQDAKSRLVMSPADVVVLVLLIFQICTGLYVAFFHRWGSTWFATSLSPYLWSIVKLNPDISYVIAMPLMVKLHIISAFTMIFLFPYTRLVHMLVVPNPYLWRRPQVVRWNWNPKAIRKPDYKVVHKN